MVWYDSEKKNRKEKPICRARTSNRNDGNTCIEGWQYEKAILRAFLILLHFVYGLEQVATSLFLTYLFLFFYTSFLALILELILLFYLFENSET